MRLILGAFLLTIAMYGCSPPTTITSGTSSAKPGMQQLPVEDMWVASDDGKLALRLSVLSRSVRAKESIHVAAEIRNESAHDITVLRPFGDSYAARAIGMKIWDGQRQIRYTGPNLSYVVGSGGFAIVKPGKTMRDKLALTIDNFAGMEPSGTYTLRYDYSYNGQWDTAAAAGDDGIRDAWRGTISSREVQVVRE